MSEESINITLVYTATGQSEALPVQATTTTVKELQEWASALFGVENTVLAKDGKRLTAPETATLQQAGIVTGDLLAVATHSSSSTAQAPRPAAAASAGGGLDFSSLLGNSSSAPAASAPSKEPVYYPGMNLSEAQQYNPHPVQFVTLLLEKEHLRKELNYYSPKLAARLTPGVSIERAAEIWREELVKGGIENAMRLSNKYHEENVMKERLTKNPNDEEAKKYFAKKDKQKLIDEQYHHVMEEYPESFGRVLMLYVAAKINGHDIQAFCDSGAQSTIMSKRLAVECGLGDLIDERMSGTAVGVGTGKILGRIHIVQLQLGDYYFPCSVTVMDDPPPGASEMPFLLGLDMMKRHTASIDLANHCLKFRIAPDQYMEAPFLHEKDLDKEQGGTKGFDAQQANAEFLKRMEEEDDDKMED